MLSKNKKNIKMKNCYLYIIMMLLLASCSEQQVMEETSSLQKLTEQKGMTVTPKDSVASLFNQARWGDSSAYLKLADCYRDGFGVKKDLLGVITMTAIAEELGGIQTMDDYFKNLPNEHEYKTLYMLMGSYKSYIQESADSVMQVLRGNDSPEAQTLLAFVLMDQGDTITAKNLIREAANKGCSLAEIYSMVPDGKDLVRADAAKLAMIAEQVPLIYSLLGNLYYEPDENGKTEEQLAVEYYMKAEEWAVLGRKGATRVLDYYKSGGNIQLTEDDIKRLELIAKPRQIENETAK